MKSKNGKRILLRTVDALYVAGGSMENDAEYEGIFNDDEVVDVILYDKVEKELDEKKTTGCLTTLLAISGGALHGLLFLI
jgi:hypothetical protein